VEEIKCELCNRPEKLTKHHLIPRTRHKNKKVKREIDRATVKSLVWLCKLCHRHLHAIFTEKELERQYNTLEQLKEHPEVCKFVNWVKDKPVGTSIKTKKKGTT